MKLLLQCWKKNWIFWTKLKWKNLLCTYSSLISDKGIATNIEVYAFEKLKKSFFLQIE